ncbi:MAG TPA: nucleoside deaminase [Terriglobia bacterium]|jgi:guanine deaminase|nr:nucleoside deaminase [Terriglobia bacterium]
MHEELMRVAIALSIENVRTGRGGPFAAVVAKDGALIGRGVNLVTATNDPTAHAEVSAIRAACQALGSFHLTGCELYTTCEPCPMCLGAIYWARLARYYYGNTRSDAARIGFDDSLIYQELSRLPEERGIGGIRLLSREAVEAFNEWMRTPARVPY